MNQFNIQSSTDPFRATLSEQVSLYPTPKIALSVCWPRKIWRCGNINGQQTFECTVRTVLGVEIDPDFGFSVPALARECILTFTLPLVVSHTLSAV